MTLAPASTRRKGAAGEDIAAAYLEERGWAVLARNFRTRRGEIDIIAAREDEVAFVEVKAWDSLPPSELEFSIDGRKRGRIARAAREYLSRRPELTEKRLRFDVIFLGKDTSEVQHIENAFTGGID